jgi:hypothetical protein
MGVGSLALGFKMDMETPPSVGLFDACGVIVADLECKKCSYNLRGLRDEGRCPECGTPIGLSTRGDFLRFSNPDWVDKVALGLKIILWMILVSIVVRLATVALRFVAPPILGQGLTFLASLLSFYGVWLMTEPDPSGVGEDPNLTPRKLVRVTLVVGLIGQALQIVSDSVSVPAALEYVSGALLLVAALVALVGEFAKFIYYEKLSLRIPDGAAARRARFLRWAYVITLGFALLGGAVAALIRFTTTGTVPGGAPPPALMAIGCLFIPAGIAWLVFGLMTLSLLVNLRRMITEQARLARETWAVGLIHSAS